LIDFAQQFCYRLQNPFPILCQSYKINGILTLMNPRVCAGCGTRSRRVLSVRVVMVTACRRLNNFSTVQRIDHCILIIIIIIVVAAAVVVVVIVVLKVKVERSVAEFVLDYLQQH